MFYMLLYNILYVYNPDYQQFVNNIGSQDMRFLFSAWWCGQNCFFTRARQAANEPQVNVLTLTQQLQGQEATEVL